MGEDKKKRSRFRKVSIFKEVDETPSRFLGNLCPTNLEEQKEGFLKHGILPKFKMRTSQAEIDKITAKSRGQIRFDLLNEAKVIIQKVKKEFGDGQKYLEAAYGPPTDFITGTEVIAKYLMECNCEGEITVYWTRQLECSAKMMWHGPNLRFNRPEARRYTLIIKNSLENQLMRTIGIQCLADHEIGTHYMRMINDGLQPWFSDRSKFGLRPMSCRESSATEEGLATLNTILNSRSKYIWKAALTYYTACMATEMSFRELFIHLEKYIRDPEQRWKQVMRVKRGLADCNAVGGYGNDQVYFEGAVEIIRNMENIDFHLLYSGKVCVDELSRIRRLARCECIKLPKFMKDIEKYKRSLRQMGYVNGLIARPEKRGVLKCCKGDLLKTKNAEMSSMSKISRRQFSCFGHCAGSSTSSVTPSPTLTKGVPLTKSTNNLSCDSNFSHCFKCNSFSDDEDNDRGDIDIQSVSALHSGIHSDTRLLSRPKKSTNKINAVEQSLSKSASISADSSSTHSFGLLNRAPKFC